MHISKRRLFIEQFNHNHDAYENWTASKENPHKKRQKQCIKVLPYNCTSSEDTQHWITRNVLAKVGLCSFLFDCISHGTADVHIQLGETRKYTLRATTAATTTGSPTMQDPSGNAYRNFQIYSKWRATVHRLWSQRKVKFFLIGWLVMA